MIILLLLTMAHSVEEIKANAGKMAATPTWSPEDLAEGDRNVNFEVAVIFATAACIKLADSAIQAITGTPIAVIYPDLVQSIPDIVSAGYMVGLGAKVVFNRLTHRGNAQRDIAPAAIA